MKLIRTRNLFCAAAVMTACTFCTAGFTSYAMSPDQGNRYTYSHSRGQCADG